MKVGERIVTLLFNVSAAIEVLTGIVLLIAPAYLVGLLLGSGLSHTGTAVTRAFGIGLFSLGIASWSAGEHAQRMPRVGICAYNLGLAAILTLTGAQGHGSGILLWPVAALHGLIGVSMLWVMLRPAQKSSEN